LLDNRGISAATVRERINELEEAWGIPIALPTFETDDNGDTALIDWGVS